jgi:hypothetical protein
MATLGNGEPCTMVGLCQPASSPRQSAWWRRGNAWAHYKPRRLYGAQSVQGVLVLTYRCFILDGTGDICERLSIECDNDKDAITKASAALESRPEMVAVEIWDGARLVQKVRRATP